MSTKYNIPTLAEIERALHYGKVFRNVMLFVINYHTDFLDELHFKVQIDADPYIHSSLQFYTYATNGVIDYREDITYIELPDIDNKSKDNILDEVIDACSRYLEGFDADTEETLKIIDQFKMDGDLYDKLYWILTEGVNDDV